jgi:ATP-dependent RNA helicase CshB
MKFSSFALKEELIEALDKLGYLSPTAVQYEIIPKALRGESLVVQSETGSGKTHAFLIPLVNSIVDDGSFQALIVAPTRELARQTYEFLRDLNEVYPHFTYKLFTSGEGDKDDLKSFLNGAEIIVASPGKIEDLLAKSEVDLSKFKTLILDEADMLFEGGFLEMISKIIANFKNPQIEVYSATINRQLEAFLRGFLPGVKVDILSSNLATNAKVRHHLLNIRHQDVEVSLLNFLKIKNPYFILIFANSKKEVMDTYHFLLNKGIIAGIMSGELERRERKAMLKRIASDEFQVVVCTDIASRGLDFKDVSDVLSIDLPSDISYYIHRAGRTGRLDRDGDSYVFYSGENDPKVRKLMELGINFDYLKLGDDSLIVDKPFLRKKRVFKRKGSYEMEREIAKIYGKQKKEKVKPGYKKKVKLEVMKVKNRYRRKAIKKAIRKELDENFRAEAKRDGKSR